METNFAQNWPKNIKIHQIQKVENWPNTENSKLTNIGQNHTKIGPKTV